MGTEIVGIVESAEYKADSDFHGFVIRFADGRVKALHGEGVMYTVGKSNHIHYITNIYGDDVATSVTVE
jgi:hypothetical protein